MNMNGKSVYVLGLAATLLANGNAVAGPLLEKITAPGFVMPSYAITKRCLLNDTGQMTIKYGVSTLSSARTQAVTLNKTAVKTAINNAVQGHVTQTPPLPDVGLQTYAVYQVQPDGTSKRIVIWQTAGGTDTLVNDSVEAVTLRNFIDVNCGDPLNN